MLDVVDGTILASNLAARRLGGHEHAPGTRVLADFITEEQRPIVESYRHVACNGGAIDFETTIRCADGSTVPVAATLFPLRRGAKVIGVGARVRDISMARLSEQWLLETEQRFRSLFDFHPDAVALIDHEGAVVLLNRAAAEMSGRRLEDVALRPIDQALFAPDVHEALRERIAQTMAGTASEFESAIVDGAGVRKEVVVKTVPAYVESKVAGAYVIAKDVSAQKAAERDASEQNERIRALYLVAASAGRSTAEQIQATLELGTHLLQCNFSSVSEVSAGAVVVSYGVGIAQIGASRKTENSYIRHVLEQRDVVAIDDLSEPPWNADPARRNRKLTAFMSTPVEVFGKARGALTFGTDNPGGRRFREADKDFVRLMGALVGSALERLDHEQRLGALAFYDALTGLPNRVLFDDRLTQTLVAARRHRQRFAVLYVDLDHFKEVNDAHGHAGGDELLRVVAHRLLSVARESDTVARQGGDEFVVLQRFVRSSGDAVRLAHRINESLRQPIAINEAVVAISASVGIALYPDDGKTTDELVANADAALYRAKDRGRDRTILYESLGK